MVQLGITRKQTALMVLQEKIGDRDVTLVPLPLIEPRPIEFELPDDSCLEAVDWLFFTSANGVKFFFDRIKQLNLEIPESVQIVSVGRRTSDALNHAGYKVNFFPSESLGQKLFEEFVSAHGDEQANVLYASAREVNFDPAELFASTKLVYNRIVCYEVLPTDAPIDLSGFTSEDFMLFTAPSAVRTFDERFGIPTAHTIAIGKTTAAAMIGQGWPDPTIMRNPDVNSVLEYIPCIK